MAESLGTLRVALEGDTKTFNSAIDGAHSQIKTFDDATQKHLKNIGLAMTGFGIGVGTALAGCVASFISAGDNLDKMSRRSGVAVESLSALGYAAKISGTDMPVLEKALTRLAINMQDTASGTGEAKEAFDKLGISVTDSSGNLRKTEDVLMDAADKIADLTNSTDQSAYAATIFGARYGPELLPLLKESGKGIKDLTDKAERLGLVMSTESAEAAAELNDRLTDLKESLKMAAFQTGTALAPALETATEKLTDAVGWFNKLPDPLKQIGTYATAGAGAIGLLGGSAALMASKLPAAIEGFKTFGGIIGKLPLSPTALGVTAIGIAAVGAYVGIKDWNREAKDFAETQRKLNERIDPDGVKAIRAIKKELDDYKEVIKTSDSAVKESVMVLGTFTDRTGKSLATMKENIRGTADAAEKLEEVNPAAYASSWDEALGSLTHTGAALVATLHDLNDKAADSAATNKVLKESLDEAAAEFRKLVPADYIEKREKEMEKTKETAKGLRDLTQGLIEQRDQYDIVSEASWKSSKERIEAEKKAAEKQKEVMEKYHEGLAMLEKESADRNAELKKHVAALDIQITSEKNAKQQEAMKKYWAGLEGLERASAERNADMRKHELALDLDLIRTKGEEREKANEAMISASGKVADAVDSFYDKDFKNLEKLCRGYDDSQKKIDSIYKALKATCEGYYQDTTSVEESWQTQSKLLLDAYEKKHKAVYDAMKRSAESYYDIVSQHEAAFEQSKYTSELWRGVSVFGKLAEIPQQAERLQATWGEPLSAQVFRETTPAGEAIVGTSLREQVAERGQRVVEGHRTMNINITIAGNHLVDEAALNRFAENIGRRIKGQNITL